MRNRSMVAALATLLLAAMLAVMGAPSASGAVVKVFPGAEGYGTDTVAGRGGTICQVTNLNDSGAGSLRACATASGPRTVIFRTGGTINLNSRITVTNPNLSILGHTAPGDGITLRMAPGSNTDQGTMQIETHDVLVRYLRARPGNPDGTADDSHDGIQIYKEGVNNVVVDHASVSWAVDENVNTYDYSDNITVSWSIISEGLSHAGHPTDAEHSKGMLSGGIDAHNVSIHHNLFASNVDRNPQISGVSTADVRNNVLYNYGDGSGNGTTLISSSKGVPKVNIVNNFYRKGPSSPSNYPDWALYSGDNGCVHQVYVAGNKHNESGTTVTNGTRGTGCDSTGTASSEYPVPAVTTTSAEQAYTDVLASAGASKARDAIDQRIVSEVQNRTGSFKDNEGTYPTLATGTPPADSDGDGLPDSWENSGGGTTPNGDQDGDGYTNIEEWAESLIGGGTPPPPTNSAPTVSAGPDQSVTLPAAANLDGTVTDDGQPSGTLTQSWTKVSGPGTVTFGSPNAEDTTASFSQAGTYVLQLSASDGALSASDQVQVVVSPPVPGNTPPSVSAGADQTITLPASASLDGTVSDPDAGDTVTTGWSKVSGPGTVTFGNASSVDTSASFSVDGSYVLRLTANDGSGPVTDDVQVTVQAAPPPTQQTPTASRGSTVCGEVTVNYGISSSDTQPSDFEFNIEGDAQGYDTLTPPGETSGVWQYPNGGGALPEDSAGGSVDVDVQANGQWILHYEVSTNCQADPPPPSGVQQVATGYAHNAGSSVVLNKPSGLLAGDKIVFHVSENKGTGGSITAPSSVTALASEVNDGTSMGGRTYVHTVSASSPASWTFSGSAFSQMQVSAVAYRGAGAISEVAHRADSNENNSHSVWGTSTASAVLVYMGADRVYASGAVPNSWTLDTRLTERLEGAGPKSGSAFSAAVGDTGAPVAAGDYDIAANVGVATPYAVMALIQVQPAP